MKSTSSMKGGVKRRSCMLGGRNGESPVKGGRRSFRMRGGARTQEQRQAGAKCAGEMDPISLNDIPPQYAIRLNENEHFFCFDVRSLQEWFNTGNRTNPSTGLRFSDRNIDKIMRKIQKAGLAPPPPVPTLMDRERRWFTRENLEQYGEVRMYNVGFAGNQYSSSFVRYWKPRDDNIISDVQTGPQNWFYEIIPSGRDGIIEIFTRDAMSYRLILDIMIPMMGPFNHHENNILVYSAWEF